jgi:ketosteroid isomerase-like protein
MSQQNVEIVRNVYEAVNRRDWDAIFRDAHPDVEMTTQRGPNSGTHRGRKRVTAFLEDYIAAFDTFIWEPEEFFAGGDQVVAFVTSRSRPRGGSVDLAVRNGHCWTIRDRAILAIETFPEPKRALQAAGLHE